MRFWGCVALFLSLTACNYNHVEASGQPAVSTLSADQLDNPDYATVQMAVIAPQCLSCHSNAGGNKGGMNLETYRSLSAALNRVLYRATEVKDMPPGGSLNAGQISLLKAWDADGSPETVAVSDVSEKPDPKLMSGPTNWTKVHDAILVPKCLACHEQPNPQGLDVDSYDDVRAQIHVILDRITQTRDMPVPPLPAVTKRERDLIWQWYSSGMPK